MNKDTIIETERLILRSFKVSDAEFMFKNWASDERVTKYLTWKPYKNIEDVIKRCVKLEKNSKDEDDYHWAIVLKSINEPIGDIGIVNYNKNKRTAEIGYCLGYDYWNKGIMTEALMSVINYLKLLDVDKIYAEVDSSNINSQRLLTKCGFKKENDIKKDYNNSGEPIDLLIYSHINEK